LGWPCSSGRSVAGSLCSSSADQSGAILIATANRAGSPCDATGPRLPALPAPSRARPAARSDIATPIEADLRRRAEADLSVAAAGRPLDAEARQPQVPGRRGYEHGRRAGKTGRKESRSCPRRYGSDAIISRFSPRWSFEQGQVTLSVTGAVHWLRLQRSIGAASQKRILAARKCMDQPTRSK
jgi:hypothetical protein